MNQYELDNLAWELRRLDANDPDAINVLRRALLQVVHATAWLMGGEEVEE